MRTGRTSAMMNDAITVAATGQTVLVVCATAEHARQLGLLYRHPNLKIETVHQEPRGRRAQIFIDHYAWEAAPGATSKWVWVRP